MKRFILFLLIITTIFSSLFAQKDFEKYKDNDLLRYASISFLVKELGTNKVVAEYQSHYPLRPASTLKLITTITALEVLGKDFRFPTTLEYNGKITKQGVLKGNLYIRGSYDPTLGSKKMGDIKFLDKWLESVKKAGIKRISGKIIALLSPKDKQLINPKWIWEDIGNYYAPTIQAISYKDNTYRLTLRSKSVGTTPKIISITPKLNQLKFENNVVSAKIGYDSAYIYGSPYSNKRKIFGKIPANRKRFTVKGDIPNPALLLVKDFAWKLKSNNIRVGGVGVSMKLKRKMSVIYTHYSPTIKEIITETNVKSNNHYAEHLYHYLNRKEEHFIYNYWKKRGMSVSELFQYDGSGLSPFDAVSANFLVEILQNIQFSDNYKSFQQSLAISGKKGTLKHFLDKSSLSGKIYGKSGSLEQTKSYAGYCYNNGKEYVFAIIINNANGKNGKVKKEIEHILTDILQ
ncbi:MAG: D-alanyl-D-alanine carboxypeptidase/D-alanyl-D-alanine-endopeptidase [Paludibacter sp.]|nr:MAG: D-alanyl-D-alanine carboxypeptidase/D-alanyl-D-alanine-endopeptidase [Paludibacter sp.]